MLSLLLAGQAILHAIMAAEFDKVHDGRLTLIFIVAAVVDAMAAWVAKNERV